MQNQSQENNHINNSSQEQQNNEVSCALLIMFGYLYFGQGMILAVSATMPYIYPQLPDYITLSLFSLATLPYSLKFITAPFIQRYSNISYGKKKTWVMIGQSIGGICLLFLSFFTQQDNARFFAAILLFAFFFNSLQDIALDGLCLKQLKRVELMATVQAACQGSGVVISSLILLKFTSRQFSELIGLQNPITSVQTLLIIFGLILLIPTFIIHFLFKQTFYQAEARSSQKSIFKVISYYRVYLKPSYTYFRRIIFLVFYYQGLNFFLAGYNYQLIHKGFSRDSMNTIDNVNNVIVNVFIFLLGTRASVMGRSKALVIQLSLTVLVLTYLWIWFPIDFWTVAITSLLVGFLSKWDFMLTTQICGDFPPIGIRAMYFTMHASGANLGKMLFIQTAILDKLPWKEVALVGLIVQVIMIILIPMAYNFVMQGQTSIDSFYPDEEEQYIQNLQEIQNQPNRSN